MLVDLVIGGEIDVCVQLEARVPQLHLYRVRTKHLHGVDISIPAGHRLRLARQKLVHIRTHIDDGDLVFRDAVFGKQCAE
ncbi:hypothetical protein D3C80_2108660 [compost metagenome]